MTSAGRPATEQRKLVSVAGYAEAAVRLAEAKAILGPQQGERAERIAALRQEIARAVAPMSR